jgi:hypothetical protein
MFSRDIMDFVPVQKQPFFMDKVMTLHRAWFDACGSNFVDIKYFSETEIFLVVIKDRGTTITVGYDAPIFRVAPTDFVHGENNLIFEWCFIARPSTPFPCPDLSEVVFGAFSAPTLYYIDAFSGFWTDDGEEFNKAMNIIERFSTYPKKCAKQVHELNELTELDPLFALTIFST